MNDVVKDIFLNTKLQVYPLSTNAISGYLIPVRTPPFFTYKTLSITTVPPTQCLTETLEPSHLNMNSQKKISCTHLDDWLPPCALSGESHDTECWAGPARDKTLQDTIALVLAFLGMVALKYSHVEGHVVEVHFGWRWITVDSCWCTLWPLILDGDGDGYGLSYENNDIYIQMEW